MKEIQNIIKESDKISKITEKYLNPTSTIRFDKYVLSMLLKNLLIPSELYLEVQEL